MTRARAWIAIFALCACGNADPRPREPQPLPKAARVEPAASPAAPEPAPKVDDRDPTPEEVPVPEDFRAEAAQKITRKNLKAELDAIEAELNADKL